MGAGYEHARTPLILQARAIGNLLAGASYVFPAGEVPIMIHSADVDTPDLRLRWGTVNITTPAGVAWAGIAGIFVILPLRIKSDGVNYRITNTGVNTISNIQVNFEP